MKLTEQFTAVDSVRPIRWEDGCLKLLDQRQLPGEIEYLTLDSVEAVAQAIRDMVVRGAPAIGIAAAYGFVLAVSALIRDVPHNWRQGLADKIRPLLDSRPTAVNLGWAVKRMQNALEKDTGDNPLPMLLAQAQAIHNEDIAANLKMGELGAACLGNIRGVLTHCNTGSLATGGYGTALGVIRSAFALGLASDIYAAETRPWLQGSRLTAWELQQDNIPVTLVADSAAAWLMQSGRIQWVIVGADRIAANGDVANKIGTCSHAINARYHGLGFMVVAPVSTIDLQTDSGSEIEIEERKAEELLEFSGKRIAPPGTGVCNPVFDITPASLVSVLVTEKGIIEAPDREKIAKLMNDKTG
ncbi:MAG: S-methyl-5-thioribose-1-phosphate isomerase [Gammaproteobacteria bacterium]